jgi:hypothetical protein
MRSDAIIAADREGIVRFWNSGAGRLFGYSPDEAISRSLDFIIPERLRQRHWDGYRRVMETGKSRYGESDTRPNHPSLFESFARSRIVGCSTPLWPALWDDPSGGCLMQALARYGGTTVLHQNGLARIKAILDTVEARPLGASFHVWKLIAQRGDAALGEPPRSAINEWVEHSGSRSMREDIAGARARRRQQQPADAVCGIDCNGYRRDA